MRLQIAYRLATSAALLVVGAGFGAAGVVLASPDTPTRPVETATEQIPHCEYEEGGPQPVCIWDSAVDGNGLPAAPDNVVILYVTAPGQEPVPYYLKQ